MVVLGDLRLTMNSLQPKKDDIIRHPLNELAVDRVVRLLLQGRELRVEARTRSREIVIDGQSLNHSSEDNPS